MFHMRPFKRKPGWIRAACIEVGKNRLQSQKNARNNLLTVFFTVYKPGKRNKQMDFIVERRVGKHMEADPGHLDLGFFCPFCCIFYGRTVNVCKHAVGI